MWTNLETWPRASPWSRAAIVSSHPLYDLHCHILPDLDDGPESEEQAVAIITLSAEQGVTGMVATPHSQDVLERGGMPVLEERLATMRKALAQRSVQVELMPGMEQRMTPDLPELLQQGRCPTLNGSRYVLVELDFIQWANYTQEVLFQVQLQGKVPVLAHVERQATIQQRPALLEDLVQRGALAQITAASLKGGFGPQARRAAEQLLKRGLVHIIASDTHRPTGPREPFLAGVAPRLEHLVGQEAAHTLLYKNPAAMVADGPVIPVQPHRRLGLLRRSLPW